MGFVARYQVAATFTLHKAKRQGSDPRTLARSSVRHAGLASGEGDGLANRHDIAEQGQLAD